MFKFLCVTTFSNIYSYLTFYLRLPFSSLLQFKIDEKIIFKNVKAFISAEKENNHFNVCTKIHLFSRAKNFYDAKSLRTVIKRYTFVNEIDATKVCVLFKLSKKNTKLAL